jgi:hypothetical protein
MTDRPDEQPRHPDPAADTGALDELGDRLAALLRRLGRPDTAVRRPADVPDPALDALSQEELIAASARTGRAYLAELDRHLAAGRLLDMDILEQRAG